MDNFKEQYQKLNKADQALNMGNEFDALMIISDCFGNDTNKIYAFVLTESNSDYALHSKKLVRLVEKYLIKVLMENIFGKDNKHN